jgi:hypothetical protein
MFEKNREARALTKLAPWLRRLAVCSEDSRRGDVRKIPTDVQRTLRRRYENEFAQHWRVTRAIEAAHGRYLAFPIPTRFGHLRRWKSRSERCAIPLAAVGAIGWKILSTGVVAHICRQASRHSQRGTVGFLRPLFGWKPRCRCRHLPPAATSSTNLAVLMNIYDSADGTILCPRLALKGEIVVVS